MSSLSNWATITPLAAHCSGTRSVSAVAREDEAAEVGAEAHGVAAQLLGQADQASVVGALELVVVQLGSLGEHLAQLGGAAPGHLLGERVDLVGAKVEGARHDADRRRRVHRLHGGDHGHLVGAEALVDVLDDLVAAPRAEVDVDVGHLAPRGVEEALEEQVVRDGIGVGDVQHVADDRVAGRAAARVEDAALARELDDVAHGQEVLGEAELLDDAQLAVEALEHLGGDRPVALFGAAEAVLAEQRVGGLAARQRIGGEVERAETEVEVAARRDAGACWRAPAE